MRLLANCFKGTNKMVGEYAKEYVIDVVTRLQDNGDGGYTMYVYNDGEQMVKDHPKFQEFDTKKKKFYQRTPSQKEIDEILDGEDEYENGYIGTDKIKITIKGDRATLSKPLSFSAGQ